MGRLAKKPPGLGMAVAVFVLLCVLPADLIRAGQRGSGEKGGLPDDLQYEADVDVGITTVQQMDFGQLADKDGAVVLGLADTIVSDPNLISYGGSPYSAVCTITGDPNVGVDITISSTPASGLSLGSFVTSEGTAPLMGVLLDGSGQLVLNIGATLTVDEATAAPGPGQTVSYTITSIYN